MKPQSQQHLAGAANALRDGYPELDQLLKTVWLIKAPERLPCSSPASSVTDLICFLSTADALLNPGTVTFSESQLRENKTLENRPRLQLWSGCLWWSEAPKRTLTHEDVSRRASSCRGIYASLRPATASTWLLLVHAVKRIRPISMERRRPRAL